MQYIIVIMWPGISAEIDYVEKTAEPIPVVYRIASLIPDLQVLGLSFVTEAKLMKFVK